MAFITLPWALTFVETQGYLIIFLMMVLEGPMITTAAAFASSLGILNISLIFVLSLIGDVTGDIIHYFLGRFLRGNIVEKHKKYFKIKEKTIKKLENKIHNNLWKSMAIIKITPPLSSPGLLLIGALRIPFLKYLLMSILTTLPLTIFYTSLGFYFGFAIKTVLEYFKIGQYSIFFMMVGLLILFFGYRIIYKKITKKLEK